MSLEKSNLVTFSAVIVTNGQIRRIWLEAESEPEAREFCVRFNAGFEGAAERPKADGAPLPEACGAKAARTMLGGVSKNLLYKWLALGLVDRVPRTRRLLITRESIERGDWRRA